MSNLSASTYKKFVLIKNILNVFKINCTHSKDIVRVQFFLYMLKREILPSKLALYLQYNTVGQWVHGMIVPLSDGPMFILIDWE